MVMPSLYLTPAAISYLNQFVLALLITSYLGFMLFKRERRSRPRHSTLLFAFFLSVTVFSLLFFLNVAFLRTERLSVIYLDSLALGISLVFLIQFAYSFPVPEPMQRGERRIALLCGGGYCFLEAGFTAWRLILLHQGTVIDRPALLEALPILGFLWVVIVFVRDHVQRKSMPTRHRFALIFLIPLWLTVLSLLNTLDKIDRPFLNINMSVGILLSLFLFALNYLAAQPEMITLTTRFAGAFLTSMLTILGILPWLVAPAYAARYVPVVLDQRTLHFAPNQRGGYTITESPFHFEQNYGQSLHLTNNMGPQPSVTLAFTMPFYGQLVHQIAVSDDGVIGMHGAVNTNDLEFHFLDTAAIMPLLVDLNPSLSPDGGVFARQERDRLVITYWRLRGYYYPDDEYTFQTVLRADGSFDFTYNGLPTNHVYAADDRPNAMIWAIGAKPAHASGSAVDFSRLPLEGGPEGSVHDEYRAFRLYLHQFLMPLAIMILSSSLFFLVVLPLILYYSLMRPLNALLRGIQALNDGNRAISLVVASNDEIGFLTRSFNRLVRELNSLIRGLEGHVAERTADLVVANERLRKLSIAVEQSPSAILITDLAANIEYVNAAFTRSTGYSFAEVVGKNPRVFKSPQMPHTIYTDLWATLLAGQTWRGELCNRRKDGSEFWELTVIAPISDETGQTTHYVAVKEDMTARKLVEAELAYLATIDPLSGLSNRRHFHAEAAKLFGHACQPPYDLAVLMLDIDYFKRVNDTYGHQVGDVVIQAVAWRLQQHIRPSDLLGRYGGEEFVVLLPYTSLAESCQIAKRILQAIRESPVAAGELRIAVTISGGLAHLSAGANNLDELLAHADHALYQAKHSGRDQCVVWDALTLSGE